MASACWSLRGPWRTDGGSTAPLSRGDADKFYILGVALFRITAYRYHFLSVTSRIMTPGLLRAQLKCADAVIAPSHSARRACAGSICVARRSGHSAATAVATSTIAAPTTNGRALRSEIGRAHV